MSPPDGVVLRNSRWGSSWLNTNRMAPATTRKLMTLAGVSSGIRNRRRRGVPRWAGAVLWVPLPSPLPAESLMSATGIEVVGALTTAPSWRTGSPTRERVPPGRLLLRCGEVEHALERHHLAVRVPPAGVAVRATVHGDARSLERQ